MKVNVMASTALCLCGLCLVATLTWTGCGSHSGPDPSATAQAQEMEKLRQENQELADARTANAEVERLRQENADLPKLRNQYQEAARLRKDNEALRQQIAKISPSAATQKVAAVTAATLANGAPDIPQEARDRAQRILEQETTINEGDDVMLEPKYLKQLLPDIDWEKVDRKDPLGVKAILEQNGVQITNIQQLHEMGLTNFVIRRAVVPPPLPGQDVPANK